MYMGLYKSPWGKVTHTAAIIALMQGSTLIFQNNICCFQDATSKDVHVFF